MKKLRKSIKVLAHSTPVPNFRSFGPGTAEMNHFEDLTGERKKERKKETLRIQYISPYYVWLKYKYSKQSSQ